jgi:hypothetical protein
VRYLKTFERSYYFNPYEVKKFCQDNLMYLLDDGFIINTHSNLTNIYIGIKKDIGFKWYDIKYDFITFLELLDDKYNIQFGDRQFGDSDIIRFTDVDNITTNFNIKKLIEDVNYPKENYVRIDIFINEK